MPGENSHAIMGWNIQKWFGGIQMRRKQVLSWLLALALTAGLLVWPAPKAEAASDAYKGWVQTDSRWAWTVMGPPDIATPRRMASTRYLKRLSSKTSSWSDCCVSDRLEPPD